MENHFNKVYWFCFYVVTAGLIMLTGLIWIPVPQENQSMASTAMGFITATVLGLPLAYIFSDSINKNKVKPNPEGTTTANITAEITTDNSKPDESLKEL